LVGDEQLRKLLLGIRALPSYPGVYMEIVEVLKSKNPSADRVGEIIARDIGMSAKVVQLVNSAYFGLARTVTDPAQAAVILGLEVIRDLMLSLQVFSQFDMKKVNRLGLTGIWEHSLSTGFFSRRITKTMTSDKEMINAAFLAGLVHDMGKLLLAEHFTMKYFSTIEAARKKKIPIYQGERKTFGSTHGHLGAYLLGCWGLPVPIIEALAYHHALEESPTNGFSLAVAVHVADHFQHKISKGQHLTPGTHLNTTYLKDVGLFDRVSGWEEKCMDVIPAG